MNEAYMDNGEPVKEAATKEETDRKCPSCGGKMSFDPKTGKLHCPHCETDVDIAEDPDFVAQELDFNKAEDAAPTNWGVDTKVVKCPSCGAQTIYDSTQISGTCPYCGANQVMDAQDQAKIMAPGGVIPFKVDQKTAAEKFKKWISGKFFCPGKAKQQAHADKFQGMYVPYWTFDADTRSNYTGEYGIDRKVDDGDGKSHTETDWHRTAGVYEESFDDMLECASERMNDGLMRSVSDFDTKQVKEYKSEYMAGFGAERYTIKMKAAWEKAKARMQSIIRSNIESKIRRQYNADHVQHVNAVTSFKNITYKYILAPVWISSFQFEGKTYRFMVNGETGKICGSTPVSKLKVILTIAVVIAVIVLIRFLLMR